MQFESQGYIQISGSSEYAFYSNVFESNSYINIASYYSYDVFYSFDSDLNLSLSSNSTFRLSLSYSGSGSLGSFGSSYNFIKPYVARGGIIISSTYGRNYNAKFNFDLKSRYLAYGTGDPDFSISLPSRWVVNSGNYHWYRILACSRHDSSEENQDVVYSDDFFDEKFQDPKCGYGRVSMLTAVAARSVGEVCSVLKDPKLGPPLRFKIISIKKYVDPISGSGVRSLLKEEEFCNSPECQEFCLDFDLTQDIININFDMNVVRNIFYHESNVSIISSGSAEVLYFNQTGFGTISLSGRAEIISPLFAYDSKVELLIENKFEFLFNPLLRSFNGSIVLSGSVLDFISPKYNYNSLLSLNVQSDSEILYTIPFDSYAFINLEGDSEIDADQNFTYESSGFIVMDSAFDRIESSYFEYDSNGDLLLSGSVVDLLSSSWKYDSSGAISVFGYGEKIGRCHISTAYFETSGSAIINKSSAFNFNGSLELSGVSETISPNRSFISTGSEFNLEGEADLNFTNFGLLVAHANMKFSYLNLLIESQQIQDNQSNLSINTGVVDTCGCISTLNVDMLHNLRYSGSFSNFLKRNPLVVFDTNLPLRYKSSRNSWYNSTSVQGLSDDNKQVVWQFITELSCTNIIENQNFDDYYLKFNFLVKYKKLDKILSTSFLVNINSKQICRDSRQISMVIIYDIFKKHVYVDNTQTDFYKLLDGIGLFSNNYWGNKKDYSPSRPRYCESNTTASTTSDPLVIGSFPEFRININNPIDNINQSILDGCSVDIENPTP